MLESCVAWEPYEHNKVGCIHVGLPLALAEEQGGSFQASKVLRWGLKGEGPAN